MYKYLHNQEKRVKGASNFIGSGKKIALQLQHNMNYSLTKFEDTLQKIEFLSEFQYLSAKCSIEKPIKNIVCNKSIIEFKEESVAANDMANAIEYEFNNSDPKGWTSCENSV